MKELDSKQRAFVLYAAKVLKCSSPEELDKKLQNLSEDELNNLVQSFDQLYNQQMENNTIMARLGSKLNYIQKLNNKCPEGYEIEYYQAGGNICTRCRQKGAIPMDAKKNGGVAKDIKAEIAKCGCKAKKKKAENGTVLDKCGGNAKKKKKMQDGGKSNYDTKKVAENIKKHLNGGLIQKYDGGGKAALPYTFDYKPYGFNYNTSIFNPKNINLKPAKVAKMSIRDQSDAYFIPYSENSPSQYGGIHAMTSDVNPKQSTIQRDLDLGGEYEGIYLQPKEIVSKPSYPQVFDKAVPKESKTTKPVNPLGGGLYQWMIENKLGDLASFQTRKKLAANYGIPNYIGTTQQNAELQRLMQNDLKTHINIADRLNY